MSAFAGASPITVGNAPYGRTKIQTAAGLLAAVVLVLIRHLQKARRTVELSVDNQNRSPPTQDSLAATQATPDTLDAPTAGLADPTAARCLPLPPENGQRLQIPQQLQERRSSPLHPLLNRLPCIFADGKRLEILIHQVSHKDMVLAVSKGLGLGAAAEGVAAGGSSLRRTWSQAVEQDDTALARPKFSKFRAVSELVRSRIAAVVEAGGRLKVADFPSYSRRRQGASSLFYSRNQEERLAVGFELGADAIKIDEIADFRLRTRDLEQFGLTPVLRSRWGSDDASSHRGARSSDEEGDALHRAAKSGGTPSLRNRGGHRSCRSSPTSPDPIPGLHYSGTSELKAYINGVFFPLLAVLAPKWKANVADSGDADCHKLMLLVSGVGIPRNKDHRQEDNSTEVTAALMEMFIAQQHPDISVVCMHSNTNIFRYDENIKFVKRELLPWVEGIRNRMAEVYEDKWRDMMNMTISFADGSPARISAVNASLRHYQPGFMHIWELKTFWHEGKVCPDDVEVHTFEDIETTPPVPAAEVDLHAHMVITEMIRLRDDFERTHLVGNDLARFWLRKSRKLVLSVLLVQKAGRKPKLYRGTNMEVSMPTGSLCAERNVIGTALGDDLTLSRKDIKMVAVLGMALPTADALAAPGGAAPDLLSAPPSAVPSCSQTPAGTPSKPRHRHMACPPGLSLSDGVSQALLQPDLEGSGTSSAGGSAGGGQGPFSAPNTASPRSSPPAFAFSFEAPKPPSGAVAAGVPMGSECATPVPVPRRRLRSVSCTEEPPKLVPDAAMARIMSHESLAQAGAKLAPRGSVSPLHKGVRRIKLVRSLSSGRVGSIVTAVRVEPSSLNPLKPCGACTEWLKKIAEVNPDFKVITFTDSTCEGVYIESVGHIGS